MNLVNQIARWPGSALYFIRFRIRARRLGVTLSAVPADWEDGLIRGNSSGIAFHAGGGTFLTAAHEVPNDAVGDTTREFPGDFKVIEKYGDIAELKSPSLSVPRHVFSTCPGPFTNLEPLECVGWDGYRFQLFPLNVSDRSVVPVESQSGGAGPCAGDSGGPVMRNRCAVGMIRGGKGTTCSTTIYITPLI